MLSTSTCLVGILLLVSTSYAQENTTSVFPAEEKITNDSAMTYVAEWPEYVGGQKAMYKFIGDNVVYPREAENMGIEGRVIVGFTVSKTGALKDIYILKGAHPLLDAESKRIIELMPPWIPGANNGVPVNVKYKVDLVYKLPEKKKVKQRK
jgi:periplasmic protein TonB